jgi:mannose-6-phosphate isomerase-like protein (cupin superfamily)
MPVSGTVTGVSYMAAVAAAERAIPFGTIIEKPWGCEVLQRQTRDYVVKVLCVRKGCRLSLQYHRVKKETMVLVSGDAALEIHRNGRVISHSLGMPVEILPGTVHRLVAAEDSQVLEVSTPELDDVVRLDDDYGRVNLTTAQTSLYTGTSVSAGT